MLRNADYIYDNILRADEKNTTLKYCKKAQVGVDLSLKKVLGIKANHFGCICKDKTYAPEYEEIPKVELKGEIKGYYLLKGSYIIHLNEGCSFGKNDTGLIIGRSSLNRSFCTIVSCVWDPGYTSVDGNVVNDMSIRLNVDTDSVFIEENARVAQLIVFENEDVAELYKGQWQGGLTKSKLVEKENLQC